MKDGSDPCPAFLSRWSIELSVLLSYGLDAISTKSPQSIGDGVQTQLKVADWSHLAGAAYCALAAAY